MKAELGGGDGAGPATPGLQQRQNCAGKNGSGEQRLEDGTVDPTPENAGSGRPGTRLRTDRFGSLPPAKEQQQQAEEEDRAVRDEGPECLNRIALVRSPAA